MGSSGSSTDEENVIDPGIIEDADGRSETYNPPNTGLPTRLDESFLDQYFSKGGFCEIKLYSCDTGYVQIPDGTDDVFAFSFFNLNHGQCIQKGYEFREECGVTEEVHISFSSPSTTVVSTTSIGGVELFGGSNFVCEMEFSECLTGGSYAKFDLFNTPQEDAFNTCLDFTSERSVGCQGGVLKQFKVFGQFGFNLTHINHDSANHQIVNSCNNANDTVEMVVDFQKGITPGNFAPGFQLGLDFNDTTGREDDFEGSSFISHTLSPLGLKFYRTFADANFSTIRVNRRLRESGYQVHVVQAGTPKFAMPIGSDSGVDLANGMPLYHFDDVAPFDGNFDDAGFDRLINGHDKVAGVFKGGIKANMTNMKDTNFYPSNANFVIEPWDAPDYVLQDNYPTNGICINDTFSDCEYFYGDSTEIPWFTGSVMNVSTASSAQVKDYLYSSFEVYVQIMQEILKDTYFKNTDFAGPSLYNFNKSYMRDFMDYCLNRKLKIQETLPSNRGCEVNYITWHGSEYYEDQMSQVIRDVQWVRDEFVNNSTYAPLNIKGIVIVGLHGKRDFYVPSAALRQLNFLERVNVTGAGRACWFRTCNDENSLGGLINFDSSGASVESSYFHSNMWWTYKFFQESKRNRVRAYSLDEKVAIYGSNRGLTNLAEIWAGTHYRDNRKRNYKILFRNLNATPGFSNRLNLKLSKRVIPANYNNFWNSEDARNYHLITSNPKLRGDTISESQDLAYEEVLEVPIQKQQAEVCIPDLSDGDLNNFILEYTPIED